MVAAQGPEAIESASLDELRSVQFMRLKQAVSRAYENVPYYRAKFAAAEVHPSDLKQIDDITKFPFTTRADLNENYPFGLLAVPMDEIVRIHASSGTTGRPTVVAYTSKDVDTWSQLMARSIRAAGGRASDKIHVAYGYGLSTGGLGAHYGGEYLGAAVIPIGAGSIERQVQVINDFKPDIIMASPSYMLAIADEFHRQGLDARASSLRLGLFGEEPWTEGMRAQIEKRMGLDALDIYGLSEIMGPGVAQECIETKDGLTVWEDHFLPEIIDPESGAPLADGTAGELVLTTLTKQGMPLIRYRTRDLTRLLPGTARQMRRMERVKGRSDDMLIIRGVNIFPSQVEAALAHERNLAPHYMLELHRHGHLDELEVVVEARRKISGKLTAAQHNALEHRAEHFIKAFVGIASRVRVVDPGTIERSHGKAKRVIDLRTKSQDAPPS
ncbi:phenylacetate--CoA ligase PaaK [Mesorhizobium sp. ANAO-SY3R2]|uniref:phenylacetate--CoA ligase PaaK n=1 Tax=Mesorhizobium sp. ANAO-SY3R2 TaxID=3166644 RepID=UPI003672F792